MKRRGFWCLAVLTLTVLAVLVSGTYPEPAAHGDLPENELTLTAVGDMVMHLPVVYSGFNPATGTYDFRPIFREIEPELARADLAVGVLEAPLSGKERLFSGYPRFNSPYAIADAVHWAGIDLVFTAHNHSLDQNYDGLVRSLNYYDKIGLKHTGCRTAREQPRFQILERNGIRLAFLAYTTSTNGLLPPAGKEWSVNYFDYQKIAEDIAEARKNGADTVVLALHSGVEYQRTPSAEQQKMCKRLLAMGVDIILGSHVHVIEPLEWQTVPGAQPAGERICFIAYSLGNLLSNQRWRYSDCGLMVSLKLKKSPPGPVRIVEVSHKPLWVNCYVEGGRTRYLIKKLDGPEQFLDNPGLSAKDRARIREVWSETETLLADWQKGRTDPGVPAAAP